MNNTNTGGPAFPSSEYDPRYNRHVAIGGMTLRDYFAAKALQGMLAENGGGALSNDKLAAYAYNIADEMLKAREA
jgi:hypothetical protein